VEWEGLNFETTRICGRERENGLALSRKGCRPTSERKHTAETPGRGWNFIDIVSVLMQVPAVPKKAILSPAQNVVMDRCLKN
jgi:hypothetical protein